MSSPLRRPLRLGTRGSPLALAQAGRIVQQLREQCGQPAVVVPVSTPGDESTAPIERLGAIGVFTTTLREALLTDAAADGDALGGRLAQTLLPQGGAGLLHCCQSSLLTATKNGGTS